MPYIGNPIYQSAFVTDQFSGTGSQTAFTMSVAPAGTTNVLVVVSGVVQDPSTYGVSGNTLTFSAAPPSGTGNISCRYLGVPVTGVATTAYRTVTEFTATAGQTTFTPPSYTVGYIEVNRNGVLLGSADYTATNGTTVVLTTGATAGDLITIVSFLVSSVLNAVPQSGGTISGNLVVTGTETVGGGSPLGGTTNPILAATKGATTYVQTYVFNPTNGTSSSADLVAYANNSTDAHGWADMGFTSQNFNDSSYTVTGPNEAYLFGSAPTGSGTGNLVIATDSTGSQNRIQFYNNGFNVAKANTSATINQYGLGVGTAVPSSGIGVAFPATQVPSSDPNTLDDYEEGTWTITDLSGAGLTYSVNNYARYTKVGNLVTVAAFLNVPSNASGLPFTPSLPFALNGTWYLNGTAFTNNGTTYTCYQDAGGSGFYLRTNTNGSASNANLSGKFVSFTITYQVP